MGGLLKTLAMETGLPETTVQRIIASAPVRYKEYTIDKKNGGKRLISQPAREVKLLQRVFIDLYLKDLPVHPAATAYRPGKSILNNACPHAGPTSILKMDFKDFFPSIRKSDWISYCQNSSLFEDHYERELTASLLFRKPKGSSTRHLAIGAPSSPHLSNILMFEFDTLIAEAVINDKVTYTRYADDLTFSAARSWNLIDVQKLVKRALRSISYPRLHVHPDKTTHVTTKYNRSVTGLTLANDGRVTIGKRKKRIVHAATHAASQGRLDARQLQKLAGLLAYINSVEPEFLHVLTRRYGSETISHLQKVVAKDRIWYKGLVI